MNQEASRCVNATVGRTARVVISGILLSVAGAGLLALWRPSVDAQAERKPLVTALQVSGARGQPKSWRGVIPGVSSRADAIKLLGQPARMVKNSWETLEYPSGIEGLPNGVRVEKGVVTVVGLVVTSIQKVVLNEFVTQLGPAWRITFSRFLDGAKTYVFATDGVTVVADGETGRVYLVQLYTPMSIEAYMSTLGRDLPLTNPFIK